MPKVKENEGRTEFVRRCIPEVMQEGKKTEQAIAICHSIYDNYKE